MKKFLFLLTSLFMIVNAQEFTQNKLKVQRDYPYNEGMWKFEIKLINPQNKVPKDTLIYEDVTPYHNEVENHRYDRISNYYWQRQPFRDDIFSTLNLTIYDGSHFKYNHFDTLPKEKPVFYITEDILESKTKIVYCQGIKKNFLLPEDSAEVMVSIFDPYIGKKPEFSFYEKVFKNTTFKVNTGIQGAMKYFKIDMYQGEIFIKNVYSYSVNKFVTDHNITTKIIPFKVKKHFEQTNFRKSYDLLGKKLLRK